MTERIPKQRGRSVRRHADPVRASAAGDAAVPDESVPSDDAARSNNTHARADALLSRETVSAHEEPASAHEDPAFAHHETVFFHDETFAPDEAVFIDAGIVFDEAFVAAATVREPSARARAAVAASEPDEPTRGQPWIERHPLSHWSVRPSHHFAAVRLPAVAAIAGVMSGIAVLVMLLR